MASKRFELAAKSRKRVTIQATTSAGQDDKAFLKELGYILVKKIGHGSFAKVWRAKASQFKRDVAVKIIAKHKASKEYVEKFLPRELQIIQKLKHENIIRFYEINEARHSVFIVMQLAERGTIAELVETKKHLPERTARVFFAQLMDVVEYCHRNGIVHRDIKCENLLLDRHYKLMLTDFGFAKPDVFPQSDGRVRRCRTYCGSYAYASPEVLSNVPYNPFLSDVWCMGMVLYTMLLGFLPYKQTDIKMLIAAKKKPPKFPDEPDISGRSKNFIKRMLTLEAERASIPQLRKDPWILNSVEEVESFRESAGPSRSKVFNKTNSRVHSPKLGSQEREDKVVLARVKTEGSIENGRSSDSSLSVGETASRYRNDS